MQEKKEKVSQMLATRKGFDPGY